MTDILINITYFYLLTIINSILVRYKTDPEKMKNQVWDQTHFLRAEQAEPSPDLFPFDH